MRRGFRWVLYALSAVLILLAVGALALRTEWAHDRARRLIESRASAALAADVRIGALTGSFWRGVTAGELSISQAGRPVITAGSASIRYHPWRVFTTGTIEEVLLTRLHLNVVEDQNGWNIARLGAPRDPTGQSRSLSIARIEVREGAVDVFPLGGAERHIAGLSLEAALRFSDGQLDLDLHRGSARDTATGLLIREIAARVASADGNWTVHDLNAATEGSRVSGRLRFGNSRAADPIDVTISGAPLSLEEVSRYAPILNGVVLAPTTTVSMKGRANAFTYAVDAASEAGAIRSEGRGSWTEAQFVLDGGVSVRDFDPAQWVGRRDIAGRVTASGPVTLTVPERVRDLTVRFDLSAPAATIADLQVSQARATGVARVDRVDATASGVAYGASAAGDVHWRSGTLTSSGRVRGVNVSALPRRFALPALSSRVNGAYTVEWTQPRWQASLAFDDSVIEEASVASGSTARIASDRGALAYAADVHVADLDLARVRHWVSMPEALARIDGRIKGRIRAEAQGRTIDDAIVRANAEIAGSTIAGAEVRRLDLTGSLDRRRLVADAVVDLGGVDTVALGAPAEAAATGNGTGTLHVEVPDVADFRVEAVTGSAVMTLTDVVSHGQRIAQARIDAGIAAGTATVRTFELESPDLRATASGRLAIDRTSGDQSDLAYEITISNLAVLEPWLKRRLSGTVAAAGAVTGPAAAPATTGKLRASRVLVDGNYSALGIDGDYVLELPGRDVSRLTGRVNGAASLLGISGRSIDRVTTTARFDAGRIDADTVIEAQARTVKIDGSLVPHPDHREVHIRQLALTAGNGTWVLPAGQEAVVQYAADAVTVKNLELTRGDSRIRVDGAIAPNTRESSAIDVTVERVQLADLNSVLLGTRNIAGQLDGSARIEGTMSDLRVSGSAAVTQGSVDGVAFDRLDAKADYTAGAVTLDARLQAGTSGELSARGSMPTRFGASAPADARPFDLTIQSNRLNLALLGTLSPDVEAITGTGAIDLRVTGPARTPSITGSANITDASFKVAATGVVYTRGDAALEFSGDRLIVRHMQITDADNHVASVQGGLNISVARPPSGFDLYIAAADFHVLNNPFGELSLTVDMHAMGDLIAPLLSGTIEVERGRLEVDDLLSRFGVTGYRAVGPETGAATDAKVVPQTPKEPPPPALFSKASYSITVALPDNLVLRGRDLRTPTGSFGLGDINITLGGALGLYKETGEPARVQGRLDVVRGQYAFQGRRFDIRRDSELVFSGDDPLNPIINVVAERQIGSVTAIVRATGTARQPAIALSSTPSLDEGDILSLIVFNQTMNELSTNARVNLAARAGTIAARALATPLSDSIARALDFDLFEITPSDDNATGATITVGRQVSEDLFVGFKQNVGNDDVSQVSFEYKITEFLRVVTSFAQGADRSRSVPRAETAGIDLFFVIRR
ncbi:MAG TPA: translocation/assembly module TamB domain-containing protein [Vicinamibacterales bacterium]|nr:translocation/assembly module TamB domain-containing protein [Vicinamibacterales bacterium]